MENGGIGSTDNGQLNLGCCTTNRSVEAPNHLYKTVIIGLAGSLVLVFVVIILYNHCECRALINICDSSIEIRTIKNTFSFFIAESAYKKFVLNFIMIIFLTSSDVSFVDSCVNSN